ncbi:MAG: ABC transporter ATP-binding protein [Geobacteraceae bacterium]|nr:ABC transporter ATP-binding protein [Geobacteraceae bacterium]
MKALEITGLSKIYKTKKAGVVNALSDLNLVISSGEVFGFLGPNGAGKSTTIKAIMGLIKPSKGDALIAGVPASDPHSRLNIGYLPENPSFYDFLTGREYLYFIGTSFHMADNLLKSRTNEVLDKMELSLAADRPIRGYSKGMVQRLGLAQALLHDPEIYILDEPMSGLDPLGRALVKNLIKELKAHGKTIFFSTHITADVEAVCDRVGIIVNGELRAVDKVESILEKGITGYNIHVRTGGDISLFSGFDFTERDSGILEFYTSRALFKQFMEIVVHANCEVDLVEPVRKNIESFFLELVEKR